jgi:glycosyltransferase involved in cell wall biosynthesis
MRIVVASDQWFPDYRGGSARVATATARGLAERGHDVAALVPWSASQPREEKIGSLEVLRVLRRQVVPQTIADVLESARHARRLRDSDVDVVLAHQTTVAVGVAQALDAPLSLVYHASAVRENRFLQQQERGLRAQTRMRALSVPLELLDARAVDRADSILTLSAFTESLLAADHAHALTKVERVSGGVDTDWFHPAEDRAALRTRLGVSDGPLLVTARRLEPRMGVERLLAAVAELEHEVQRLVIVGDGTMRTELTERAHELGLGERVHFAGLVDEELLRDWYRAADLVVLPTIAYEGFGLATAEALACGTPVVGTPVGATPELLGPLDPRLLSTGSTAGEIADAVDRALDFVTPAFRDACREHALAQWSWERVVPLWEDALEATIARRGVASPLA